MLLKKVYLDYIYRDSLEQLAIKSGWIKQRAGIDGPPEPIFESPREDERNYLKKKTLRLITLYENVDSDFSPFDWSPLINEGIVSRDAQMLAYSSRPIFEDPPESSRRLRNKQERLLAFSDEEALKLMKLFRKKIIHHHVRESNPGFYRRKSRTAVNTKDLFNDFAWVLENLFNNEVENRKPHLTSFVIDLRLMHSSLRECLYYSCMEGTSFITALTHLQGPNPTPTPKIIDDLYYLVRTQLTDEILVLPEPRSLSEAVEMRNSKEMRRFREVISSWLQALQEGNGIAESKIRNDIGKANRELKRLKRWEEFERSPLNFWLNSIGGWVPVFSNVLTVFSTLTGLYNMWSKRSYSWVMLAQANRRHYH